MRKSGSANINTAQKIDVKGVANRIRKNIKKLDTMKYAPSFSERF